MAWLAGNRSPGSLSLIAGFEVLFYNIIVDIFICSLHHTRGHLKL